MPSMWIVAGPNGAGKSTFTAEYLRENVLPPGILKLNADEVTVEYRKTDKDSPQDDLNLRAARFVDEQVANCIAAGQSFLVETVLSSGKYRQSVRLAKDRGFSFNLVYVSIFPPELSPSRVRERVRKGGHDVAWDKAIARYHRSHDELIWFAGQADVLMIFDNSEADGLPEMIASRTGLEAFHKRGVNPMIDAAMRQAFPAGS